MATVWVAGYAMFELCRCPEGSLGSALAFLGGLRQAALRMRLGFLDLVVVAWCLWWAKRGYRRGLPMELPRTLGVLVFGLTGFGLFHWTSQALAEASRVTGQTTTGLSFILLLVAAKLLVGQFRSRIQEHAMERWGEARPAGSLAGGLRAFMLACIILAFFAEGPFHALTRPAAKTSLLGRTLTWFLLPAERKSP